MTDQRIAQRFSVHATLEESKLGTLFWTTDEERGAPALLLLLAPAAHSDDATLQAIVADQLTAPHVLATYAFGRTDEGAWLATDAPALTAEAATLEAVLKRRDRLELAQILRLAVALARGVETLGAAGKQHLDIQPNRVWLDTGALTTGAPQLFGIGWWRLLPAYSTSASAEAFYGNPEYLAAELCKGQPASATADVYGAATTLWAIAAGKPPFPSNQPLMALKRQAVEKPLRLDLVKPALQGVKDLQAVVAEALDKEPAKRPSPAAWRALVEALAAQKAADVLQQSNAATPAPQAPAPSPAPVVAAAPEPTIAEAPAPAPQTPVDLRGTMQFTGADVAAALAAAVASAEGPAAHAPMDDAAALASLPEALAAGADDGDDEEEGAESADGTTRQGRRRRERRERQTVAGIGIAAALAEANLADQKSGGPGLAGLTPNSTPSLTGIARPESAPTAVPPSPLSAVPAAPTKPAPHGKKSDAAPPKRPDSQGSQKVIVNQSAKGASTAAVARTGRSLTVQLAEGAFFDEDAVAPSTAADLGDQAPPVPPKEKLNRKALLAIAGFAALMLGVSLWMSQHSPLPDGPTHQETPPATDEAALEPAADATTAVAAPAVEPTPVAAAAAPTPTAIAPAPVEAAPVPTAPDAGNAADTAVAPPLVPIDAAHQAEVQRLVAEGNSALMTKDPVTALAKAQEALKVNAGHAPALLLKEQAQKGVDAAIAEAKAAEAKAAEIKAAEAEAAASKAATDAAAKSAATAKREQKAQSKREAQKAAVSRAQALKAERLAAAKEASAAKARAARERAAAKKAEKVAPAKKSDSEAPAKKSDKEASTRASRPEARPVEKPADDGNSASQEASKFAALAQKASKAKLKVLYLQKAVKLDPANAGYKSQLKAAEEQLKTEGP